MRSAFLVVCAALGCASPLNPQLTGDWWGFLTVDLSDGRTSNAISTVTARVDEAGERAEVTGFCPRHDGGVYAEGSGDRAAWVGAMDCLPATESLAPCVLSYRRLSLERADGSVFVEGGGSCDCAPAVSFIMSFVGTRL